MRNLFLLVLVFLNLTFVRAQKEVLTFLQAPEIMNEAASAYLDPMAQMLASNLQSGWYNTAKTHRFLGFDLAIGTASSTMSSSNKGYHLTQLSGFEENYRLKNNSFSVAANVAGKTENNPIIVSKSSGAEIMLPKGEGQDNIMLPVISGGLGLPYNTELRVKFMPAIDKGNMGNLYQYGIGLKHSVKEYIPGLNKIPAISMALFGAYSSINSDLKYLASSSAAQHLQNSVTGYTGRLLLGFDVPVFSAYMGLGYSSSTIKYALKGNYLVGDVLEEEKDPLTVKYELGKIALDFGVKAKMGMVQVFAAYSPSEYASFSLGAGITL